MRKQMKRIIAIIAASMCLFTTVGCDFLNKDNENSPLNFKDATNVKNVILMIGDGMGPNQVRAGEIYGGKKLTMQRLPYHVNVETRSHNSYITDSSAAATAIATGERIYNGEVGLNIHGDQLETIVDIAASKGKRTGIVTTDWLAGATPMGFSSHNTSRDNSKELAQEAAISSNVNMFLSHKDSISSKLDDGGYVGITDPTKISDATEEKIYGSYYFNALAPAMEVSKELVGLDGIMLEALEYLSKDEDGFFLMAEGARIDKGGHNNSFQQMLNELMAFDAAVKVVVDWAMQRDDTIVIVTADHETGDLQLDEKANQKNLFNEGESYVWGSSGHSGVDVDCFIGGANIDFASYSFGQSDRIMNTDVFQIMKSFIIA